LTVAAIDPVLLEPPEMTPDTPATDWVIGLKAWTDLVTAARISATCPPILHEAVLARWWNDRARLVDALSAEGGPLTYHDLMVVFEELRGRLRSSPFPDGFEVALRDVVTEPDYVQASLVPAECEEFRLHLGELARHKAETHEVALVFTVRDSWSADSTDITVDAGVELLLTPDTATEFDDDDGFREHLVGCDTVSDAYGALLADAGILMATPALGVNAFAVVALKLKPTSLKFTVAEQFAETALHMNYDREHGRARTCLRTMALIAAGRTGEITGLNAHAVHRRDGGGAEHMTDAHGRTLMRGYLSQNSPDAHRLHWWNGETPEFVAVCGHDDPIPGMDAR
jgi:hypothetical protein